jgi:glc operon protein GlcG
MNTRHELSHREAQQLVDAARVDLEHREAGAAVSVVDPHGELLAFLRTDGCPLASITIAINKAFTAARQRMESREVGEASRSERFPMTNFGDPRFVTWGGGVPVIVDGEVVGAIGVSGLPEEVDMEIARAAVAAIAGH